MITQIHIPRTAGRSIRAALEKLGHPQNVSHKKISDYVSLTCTVTVVRNPFTRFESIWKNHIPVTSFEEFVDRIETYKLYAPQVNWLDSKVEILRYESLNVDWFRFCEKHNLEPITLRHLGVSYQRDIFWTKETIAKIQEFYKEDFEL